MSEAAELNGNKQIDRQTLNFTTDSNMRTSTVPYGRNVVVEWETNRSCNHTALVYFTFLSTNGRLLWSVCLSVCLSVCARSLANLATEPIHIDRNSYSTI